MTVPKEVQQNMDKMAAEALKKMAELLGRPVKEAQANFKHVRQSNNPNLPQEEIDAEAERIANLLEPEEPKS